MKEITDIINIIRSIQKKFEISKTGMDVGKTIVDPEKKKKPRRRRNEEGDINNNVSDQESVDSGIESGTESDDSLSKESLSGRSSISSNLSNAESNKSSDAATKQEKVGVFSRIKNSIGNGAKAVVGWVRTRYSSAKEYMNENYPKTAKVIGGIARGIDYTISILGGKTACRAFLIASAGLLFASGVGTIPAAIMLGVATAAVGVSVAIETGRLRKINNLKDEVALTEEYIDTNEQLKKITKSNYNVEKFFQEKDAKIQETLDAKNAAEKPKPSLFTRMQNAVPKPLRVAAKTVRDNLGEAGTYVGISALTGNVFGIITSTVYFVFGNSTTLPDRLAYEKLKGKIRDDIDQDSKEIPLYKNKYELQSLLKQQYVERDTREVLVNSKEFNQAAQEGNQKAMDAIYEKTYSDIDKNYQLEPKPGIFKSIVNYFKDIINVNVKGAQPDESLDHYTDRKYDHAPKIHPINRHSMDSNKNLDKAKQQQSSQDISKELIDEAKKLSPSKISDPSSHSITPKKDEHRAL
ncbi:hypothetical protein NOVO_01145 [Rickettsiales bacterium Ac37b]|nr:hypothetical protein NOVO_01145 [Rickettsiales bacterium Ac37b]